MTHIVIVGAGISGVTTAYTLSQLGYQVTVLDRHLYPAMETSFANGGQLSASNAEVWNSTGTLLKGIKWMLRNDAPLLLNPKPSWHKYSWIGEFVASIAHYRRNTIETTRMAIEARKHLFAMAEREQIDFDLQKRGILHVYHDKASFAAAGKANALLVAGGLERHAVSPEEIAAIEPTLRGNYYGGYFTTSDATGDIHKFTRGLAQACEKRGVRFMHGVDVRDVETTESGVRPLLQTTLDDRLSTTAANVVQDLAADAMVVCAGVGSRHIAQLVGDRINVYPVKGYSITVHLDDDASVQGAPWVSLLDESAKIVTSRLGTGVPRGRYGGVQWLQPRHSRGPHRTAGGMDTPQLCDWYVACGALGRLAPYDAGHDAARRPWAARARVLQHGPWASGLDAVWRNRCHGGRRDRARLPAALIAA